LHAFENAIIAVDQAGHAIAILDLRALGHPISELVDRRVHDFLPQTETNELRLVVRSRETYGVGETGRLTVGSHYHHVTGVFRDIAADHVLHTIVSAPACIRPLAPGFAEWTEVGQVVQ
jgi:hypothetical protein